jgi:catechol 2,3-dioxygenase-like lactoylglutathione lyase family enzyme
MTCNRFHFTFVWLTLVAMLPVEVSLRAQTAEANLFHLSPDHATLSVADAAKECQWYERVLGFHEMKSDQQSCRLSIPAFRLDILTRKGSVRPQAATGTSQQGWLNVVFKTSDIEGLYKHLEEQGITVKVDADKVTHAPIGHLTFQDPEGNEIGIAPEPGTE